MNLFEMTPGEQRAYLTGFDAGDASGYRRGLIDGHAHGVRENNRASIEYGYQLAEHHQALLQRFGVMVARDAADYPSFEELCRRRGDVVREAQARADRERIAASPSPWRRMMGGAA